MIDMAYHFMPSLASSFVLSTLSTLLLSLLPVVAAWYYLFRPKELDCPLLTNKDGDFMQIMREGYSKHRGRLFKIPTSNKPMVIVPRDMLNDMKAYPEETISFRREMYDRFLGKYTSVASNTEAMIHSVKSDLTKNIGDLLPLMRDETRYAMDKCLVGKPDPEGWLRLPLYNLSTRMIAYISSRVFVGLPLSRNDEWIDMAISSTMDSFGGAAVMWQYPRWSWPIMQWILPETKRVRHCRKRVAEILKPLIAERLSKDNDPGWKKPADLVQWLIDNSNGRENDLAFHANEHIVMNVAATHTTGNQLSNTLYSLARYPEHVGPLREEIEAALKKRGIGGTITKQTLFQLKKMDSFLREVQRMNPPSMVSTNRKTLKPIKLSDGTHIPAGTSLAASPACVSSDPTIWKNPEVFDGFRFYKLRGEEGGDKYQFTSIGEDALSFGHGRHACPGRFYAAAELKIILVELLQKFDFKLCDDYSKERPLCSYMEIMAAQDPTYELCFRRREL